MDTTTPNNNNTPGGVRLKIKTSKDPVVVISGAPGTSPSSANSTNRNTTRTLPPLTPRIRIKPLGKDTSDNLPHDLENLVRSEEQFILRLPAGKTVERLRKDIRERTIDNNVSFKFTDQRHAQIDLYGEKYRARLVDLPCIIEAQKTFNRRHFFKVGDICQMLVVEGDQPELQPSRPLTSNSNAWPDGLSAPLRDVRKRRFRKRVAKQRVEIIEKQVEELLMKDAAAEQVIYEINELRDHATPSEYDMGNNTPLTGYGHGDIRDRQSVGSDIDLEGYDSDLAAEIGRGLEQLEEGDVGLHEVDEDEDRESSDSGSGSGDDDEDEDEEEEEGEEGGPVDETSVQRRILQEEVSELEATIQKKQQEVANAANPIVKKRLQHMADKLVAELALKQGLLKEVRDRQ